MILDHLAIRHFRDCGYLRIENMLEPDLVADLLDLVRREAACGGAGAARRDGGQIKIYRLYDRQPATMDRLVRHPKLIGVLTDLLGPNVVFVKNRHNQAAVNRPGEAEPRLHRDVLQWTRDVVTVVAYLQDSTPENGCTLLIPASHYAPFMGVPQADGGGTWLDEHDELRSPADQALPVPVRAGGVLIFDGLAFHSVGPNRSTADRTSIVLGFRSADELDRGSLDDTRLMVAGEAIYRGNDRLVGDRS